MTGPEHYTAAERLLELAEDKEDREFFVAKAQVHATLALAAATARQTGGQQPPEDYKRWGEIAAESREAR